MTILGNALRVGDTVGVWWQPGRDTVVELQPYKGPLSYLWKGKARLASFAILKAGMTIEPTARFTVLSRMKGTK